jgi:diguanylate cyclase (GGDEF)-like protein
MQREQHSVAVMMCDIDHFKKVNDNFGHAMGDEVLQGVAECFSSILRKGDILARYGGEEFVILLSHISLKDAKKLGERQCRSFNDMVFTHADKNVKVSVSIGLSIAPVYCNYEINTLINTADMALYKAKELGRNRLEIAN